MKLTERVVVVTGAGDGIGMGLCEAFVDQGATVVVSDVDADAAARTAHRLNATSMQCDVSDERQLQELIDRTEREIGPIGLFCSNAGIGNLGDPALATSAPNATWQRAWEINVMAHVYAARALLPRMIERGQGYFLHTISAAGLLSRIGDAVYSTTKHAAVGFAENLAITHRHQGIRVSILCPMAVQSAMLVASTGGGTEAVDGVLTPREVGDIVVDALDKETFCILPHPSVGEYALRKIENYDRWIAGMDKLRRQMGVGRAA
ncbi:MAG: SDR family oxidoreductase [Mesorhizobium sp.]|nr:SDR family oxidoreductase [Mesorhizobium sp.]